MATTFVRELSIKSFPCGMCGIPFLSLLKLGANDAPYLSKIVFKILYYMALNTRPLKENLHYMTLNTRSNNAP